MATLTLGKVTGMKREAGRIVVTLALNKMAAARRLFNDARARDYEPDPRRRWRLAWSAARRGISHPSGDRRIVRAHGGGHQPIDRGWLKTGVWTQYVAPTHGAR